MCGDLSMQVRSKICNKEVPGMWENTLGNLVCLCCIYPVTVGMDGTTETASIQQVVSSLLISSRQILATCFLMQTINIYYQHPRTKPEIQHVMLQMHVLDMNISYCHSYSNLQYFQTKGWWLKVRMSCL